MSQSCESIDVFKKPVEYSFRRTVMIGKNFTHYEMLSELGSGGMGVVYRALDAKPDRFVAMAFYDGHPLNSLIESGRIEAN
ncbi:MAG: hypothetical protein IH853_00560 [Bacteroidetes bacterium]|nr:hypothetical protein [Bacteroidota bacterium]